MIYLIDSNVMLDVATRDPVWSSWSGSTLQRLADQGTLAINVIIYAELSVGYSSPDVLDDILSRMEVRREDLPWDAAFLAGKAFVGYRRRGGEKRSPMPDFFIGAHAACSGLVLVTRDAARYRTYFPNIELISPDDAP